jgi:hypothetical protein
MPDFEPIEIEIALNSPKALQEAAKIEGALTGLDAAVSDTESRFKAYVAQKLRANGVSVESIRLTDKEVLAVKNYMNAIQGLKTMMDQATDPTQIGVYNFKLTELQSKIDAILTKGAAQGLQNTNTTIAQQGTTLQTTKRQWDGLGNSINQITRELPAFTFSAQTGLLAISNNIPILADEINRLKLRNQELVASGGTSVPIWKQVAKSFLSWNTLLSVGVTLLTVYGKEIFSWIGSLFKGKAAIDALKASQSALNTALKSGSYQKVIGDVIQLSSYVKLARKEFIDKEVVVKKYNDTIGKASGEVKNLQEVEQGLIDKAPAYVEAMLYKAAAEVAQAEAATKLAESRKKQQEIEDEIIKIKDKKDTRGFGGYNPTVSGSVNVSSLQKDSEIRAENKKLEELLQEKAEIVKSSNNVVNSLNEEAARIAKDAGLKIFGDPEVDKQNKEKTVSDYQTLLDKLTELDKEYSRKQLTKDEEELQALKDKFDKIRTLITAFNANPKNKVKIPIDGLNALEKEAEKALTYRQDTAKLETQLDQEKEVYAAYEAFKTQVGMEAAEERYGALLNGFQNYGERLKAEYAKLEASLATKPQAEVTGPEAERLSLLQGKIAEFEQNQNAASQKRFADAYNAAITYQETLVQIEADYNAKVLELDKISNAKLRAAKIAELIRTKQQVLDALNAEAYERATIFENLSTNLMGISRRELDNRIKSIEEYLSIAKGSITEEQRAYVKAELEKAKAIKASTNVGVEEKALIERKAALVKRIADLQAKGVVNVSDEVAELEKVNGELQGILSKKLGHLSNIAGELGSSFTELGGALKNYDEGLGDTIETMGELINVVGDAAAAGASFAAGDVVGGITSSIKAITGILNIGAKARESERKALEEIKKYHDEIFASQLSYNAALRTRISDEIKLNDLYKSRVENIKEEIAANKEKYASAVKDQNEAFKKLLNAQTVVDKKTEKYGGFLGIGRKTRVNEIKQTVAELLGIGQYVEKKLFAGSVFERTLKVFEPGTIEYTDELFEKLEKINAEKPLTGDAKTAYEQLKQLRDEYGSIEEAQRELQKQLVDAVTGTTAQALADSIKEGILSGKKTFADFADDIEGFLRNAIIAGMSSKIIEPEMQKLQDQLYSFLGDGILTADEKQQFQDMYLRIAEEANAYLDLINQAGINVGTTATDANSLAGAVKGITADQADLLAGQFGGLRLTQLETNQILRANFSAQLADTGKQVALQIDIEKNTRRTADNTEYLKGIDQTLKDIQTDKASKANGI